MIDNAIYSPENADIVFLGLPFYSTCGEKGNGPFLIRKAMNSLSSFNMKSGKDAFDELRISDLGDIRAKDFLKLREKVLGKLKDIHSLVISLGGEHLATLPVVEALKPGNVLIFDAHADFYDKFNGKKYSYATVTRRISEIVPNVVVAGVRDMSAEEAESLKKSSVRVVSLDDIPKFKGTLYVSVDLDVLDPSFCPEVSTPVPLGESYGHLVKVLNRVCLSNELVGLDIVELTARKKGLSSINAGGLIMNYLKRRCD